MSGIVVIQCHDATAAVGMDTDTFFGKLTRQVRNHRKAFFPVGIEIISQNNIHVSKHQ